MRLGNSLGITRLGAVGLQPAIYSIGDSLAVMTGSNYGGTLASRMDGRFAGFFKSGDGYPSQTSATVRTQLAAKSLSKRKAVVLVWAGRNTVTTSLAQFQTDILGIEADQLAIGNTRQLYCKIPYKTTEHAAGPGDAGYDAVTSANTWLVSTLGASRVVDSQDATWQNDSGDGVHPNNAGYDIVNQLASDKLAALGWLDTSLPTVRSAYSFNCGSTNKYLAASPPIPAATGVAGTGDRLPKLSNSGGWTMEMWVKAASGASTGVLIGRYDVATAANRMSVRFLSNLLTGFFGGSANTGGSAASLVDGNWHQVVITDDGSLGKVYYDGVQLGANVATQALGFAWDVRCMEGSNGSFGFLGWLYSPRMWSTALTSGEITTLRNGGVPLAPSAVPQKASLCWCPWPDQIPSVNGYNVTRGVPDRCGFNDARATGMTSADLSTVIP
jgi:hypothetical protein